MKNRNTVFTTILVLISCCGFTPRKASGLFRRPTAATRAAIRQKGKAHFLISPPVVSTRPSVFSH